MKQIIISFVLLTCFSFVKAQNQIYSKNKEGISFSYTNNFKRFVCILHLVILFVLIV